MEYVVAKCLVYKGIIIEKTGKLSLDTIFCTDKKNKSSKCTLRSIRAESLEEDIINIFSETLFTENNIDRVLNSMKKYLNKNNNTDINKLKKNYLKPMLR